MTDGYRGPPTGAPKCQRCDVDLTPVQVLDHGDATRIHAGLAYVSDDDVPDKSMWSGDLKNVAGVIRAHVCPRCRLVAWYASPGEKPRTF
ncbi:MAG: hypothetical protein ABI175_17050 [Polyangiales bacterium]